MANLRTCILLAAAAFSLLAASAFAADPNSPTGSQGLIGIDKRGAAILFFDPATWAVISSIKTPANPHEVAISPDHRTAYVSIYGPGVYGENPDPAHTVLVIDLPTRTVRASIDVSPYRAPHGLMVDAKGTLYITCDVSRKLLVVDPDTLKITAAIDTEGTGHWMALLPDASKAYISNKSDRPYISVIDLKARKVVARIPAPHGTEGLGVSPDGSRLIVAEQAVPSLLVIDTATDTVVDTVPLQNYPATLARENHNTRVRYSLDGRHVLTSYYTSGVVSILDAADLRRQTQVIVPKGPMGFAFAPDGRTALVTAHDYGAVSVLDLADERYVSDFHAGVGLETLAFY